MSEEFRTQSTDHEDAPRVERWLAIMFLAIAPVTVAQFVPRTFHMPLFISSAVLIVIGLVMFVIHETRGRHARRIQEHNAGDAGRARRDQQMAEGS
jgi:uncharacterized membrane-anchored protein